MSDPYVGQINLFASSYVPRGYSECNGAVMSIDDQAALYSLIGCTYGGDCRTTFALPDLRGRSPIHYGPGPGLIEIPYGQKGGVQEVQLTAAQMPAHGHTLNASTEAGNTANPTGGLPAVPGSAQFTGQVPADIPVTGSTTIKGTSYALNDGKTSESRDISGNVTTHPYVSGVDANTTMSSHSIGSTGAGQSFLVQSPFLAMRFAIAITGLYPPRN